MCVFIDFYYGRIAKFSSRFKPISLLFNLTFTKHKVVLTISFLVFKLKVALYLMVW